MASRYLKNGKTILSSVNRTIEYLNGIKNEGGRIFERGSQNCQINKGRYQIKSFELHAAK